MPRPLRIEYEGAWYHVMNRGANYQNIFLINEHRNVFLSLLEDISNKFHVEIHAYCLMDNHYHLLIRTLFANLGKAMRYLDGIYTQRFNRSEKRDGPLFRGRYKAILIDAESYLLQVSRYIHLNPVSANICEQPYFYHWSSYRYFVNENNKCAWLQTNFTLDLMNEVNPYECYMKFVSDGLDDETLHFYNKTHLSSIYGTTNFVDEKLSQIGKNYKTAYVTDINQTIKIYSIEAIVFALSEYFKIDIENLKQSTQGKKNQPRMIAIFLSKELGHLTHQKIADYFTNLDRRSICTIIKRCDLLSKKDEQFKRYLSELKAIIQLS